MQVPWQSLHVHQISKTRHFLLFAFMLCSLVTAVHSKRVMSRTLRPCPPSYIAPTASSWAFTAPSPAKLRLSNSMMLLKALHTKNEEVMLRLGKSIIWYVWIDCQTLSYGLKLQSNSPSFKIMSVENQNKDGNNEEA